uniref:Ig-like domain-containing protein n=1 Tax=Kryptolebias marmoratus TaxID=37003 RepID=A0A3Q3EW57_KRYMA
LSLLLTAVYLSLTLISEAQSAFCNKEFIQREVKATLSQKAVLSCEVADTKTEVKWYKDGKLLTSSKTIHTESKGKSRQLVIDSVEQKDVGDYICEAGSEKLAFKIQVAGCGGDQCGCRRQKL